MRHLNNFIKFISESIFNDKIENKKGYVKFNSTYEGEFNSFDHFRNNHKEISPDKKYLNEVISIVKNKLGDKIVKMEWLDRFDQLYVYMWENSKYISYTERVESNIINMKYLKLYEDLNRNTIYYLTSSSIKRSELPKDITSVLNLKLGNTFNNDFELTKDENMDIIFPNIITRSNLSKYYEDLF